jgi:hypothetical protein
VPTEPDDTVYPDTVRPLAESLARLVDQLVRVRQAQAVANRRTGGDYDPDPEPERITPAARRQQQWAAVLDARQ